MDTSDYLLLITAQHRGKPKFEATVSNAVAVPVQVQSLLASMITLFDVDQAVGDQLDTIGALVGISRIIQAPLIGTTFTWDDVSTDGWDYGVWPDPFNPQTSVTLPNDVYRTLIKTKIAANSWDGTTEGAYTIWSQVFTNQNILIQDNQDMSMAIILVGGIIDSLTLGLLTNGYIPLKPETVHINYYGVPVDTNPVFGWDVESEFLGGWDEASWSKIVLTS